MRDIDGRSNGSGSGCRADALIERHHDVAANRLLGLDAQLRAEKNRPSIEITLKDCTRFALRKDKTSRSYSGFVSLAFTLINIQLCP